MEREANEDLAPPWARAGIRLAVLVLVLAGVSAYAIASHTGSSSGRDFPAGCARRTPSAVRVAPSRLTAMVAASGLRPLLGFGRLDTEGLQVPEAAWSDDPPTGTPAGDRPRQVIAGWEARWWSRPGDHLVADVFEFASPAAAHRFVALAATTTCRRAASTYRPAHPLGGHGLVWRNPLGFVQADVFFARGRRAYRISAVPPQSRRRYSRIDRIRLLRLPQVVACQLAEARCLTGDYETI